MTTDDYGTGQISPWHRYLQREHAARDAYLAVTARAHQEYLTGPWPDRDSYMVVEKSAWLTYYTAGRAAWQMYRHEIDSPPPPPPIQPAQSPAAAQFEQDQQSTRYWSAQPGFTPTNGGTQLWPPNCLVISASKRPRW
jgi:hypothetical protein